MKGWSQPEVMTLIGALVAVLVGVLFIVLHTAVPVLWSTGVITLGIGGLLGTTVTHPPAA